MTIYFQNILSKLSENLESHCTILDAKINQLNGASDQQVPVAAKTEHIEIGMLPHRSGLENN